MGLIHSRASKRRDNAQADLIREEVRQVRRDNPRAREEAAGDSLLRQPTVGGVIRKLAERRRAGQGDDGAA